MRPTLVEEQAQEIKALRAQRDSLRLALLLAYSHMNNDGNTTQWQIAFTKDQVRLLTKDVSVGALVRLALGYPPHTWDARTMDLNRAWKELESKATMLDNQQRETVHV